MHTIRRSVAPAALVGALAVLAGPTAPPVLSAQTQDAPARQLQLAFDEAGHVTLAASNVTLREILAEWTRVGGSQFANLDQLSGERIAIPLHFERQPEVDVLDSLLRNAAGIVVTPRLAGASGLSRVGSVYIIATSRATAGLGGTYPGTSSAAPLTAVPIAGVGAPDDELPPIVPPGDSFVPGGPEGAQQPPSQPASPFVGGPGGVFGQPGPSAPAPGGALPGSGPRPVPIIPAPTSGQ